MILSDADIKKCLKTGEIKIEPLRMDQIGSASVDLTLDNIFFQIKHRYANERLNLSNLKLDEVLEAFTDEEVELKPNQLVLGKTKEKIPLAPNICGFLSGRSRYARVGLAVHVTSNFMQPGISNHQILEIINLSNSNLLIKPGMRICQAIFVRTESPSTIPYAKFGKIAVKQ